MSKKSRSSARRICVKNGFERFCMPVKGQSKSTKKRTCWLFQEQFLLGRELGLLNQGNIHSPIMKYRRKWCIFFGSVEETNSSSSSGKTTSRKMMERFNSGELKKIFRNISRTVLIGLMASGKRAWQEEEETRNDSSIVLILQKKNI